jgi:hypothetical protein
MMACIEEKKEVVEAELRPASPGLASLSLVSDTLVFQFPSFT